MPFNFQPVRRQVYNLGESRGTIRLGKNYLYISMELLEHYATKRTEKGTSIPIVLGMDTTNKAISMRPANPQDRDVFSVRMDDNKRQGHSANARIPQELRVMPVGVYKATDESKQIFVLS